MDEQPSVIVAQVVLRAADGRVVDGSTPITSENIHDFLPDPAEAERVSGWFRSEGFDVGQVLGIGMWIAGPVGLFERVFATGIQTVEDGGTFAVDRSGRRSRELSLDSLAADIRRCTASVSFEEPAEPVVGA